MERFLTATTKTLDDLFLDALEDIYFAERQILKAGRIWRAAQSEAGKAGFLQHRDEMQAGSSAMNRPSKSSENTRVARPA
jgi:ferritin-like metal-binding protein YciE